MIDVRAHRKEKKSQKSPQNTNDTNVQPEAVENRKDDFLMPPTFRCRFNNKLKFTSQREVEDGIAELNLGNHDWDSGLS